MSTAAESADEVRLEITDGVGVMTIDRAASENILTDAVIASVHRRLDTIEADRTVRAVVLTAAGNEVFIIGADPKEIVAMDRTAALRASRNGQELANRLERLAVPTIAAVNGLAIGGGVEIVLACDLAIAASTARFIQLETGIGLVPGFGGTVRLPRRIGLVRARWMIYSAAPVDAASALSWGLINEVVEPPALGARARAMAATIAANDGASLIAAKAAVRRGLASEQSVALEAESLAFAASAGTPALQTRVAALIRAREAQQPSQTTT